MCTAISFHGDGHYFGRTLDHTCSYGEEVVLTPRNFPLPFRHVRDLRCHHAILGCVLEDLPLTTYQAFSELFEEDVYGEIDLLTCVQKRISTGGTSIASVEQQLQYVKDKVCIQEK